MSSGGGDGGGGGGDKGGGSSGGYDGGFGGGGFAPPPDQGYSSPSTGYSYSQPDLGNFDYLNSPGGSTSPSGIGQTDTVAGGGGGTPTIGGGFGPADTGGSPFDAGTYGGAGVPSWLSSGTTVFGTGLDNTHYDYSGGTGSFGTPGISSFSDMATSAANNPGAAGPLTAFSSSPDLSAGGSSAFSTPLGVSAPDIGTIDPTTFGAQEAIGKGTGGGGGDAGTLPVGATPTAGAMDTSQFFPQGGSTPVTDNTGTSNVTGLNFAPDQGAATPLTTPGGSPSTPTPAQGATGSPSIVNSGTGPGNNQSSFGGMNFKLDGGGMLGALASGGLLASNLAGGNKVAGQNEINAIKSNIPQIQSLVDNVNTQVAALQNSSNGLSAEAQQMMQYVSKGTLPPAMQEQVAAGAQAAKAQAISAMAARGMPTDPAKNTQLAQTLATIDSQALQLQGTLANQLYQSGLAAQGAATQTQQTATNLQNTGLQATGLTQNTYLALQKIYADQDKQQQSAIQNFAASLAKLGGGGGGGTTIKVGG